MGTGSFPGVNSGRGVTLTPHPFYCRGQERVELYLYSPYGPYGLYRASGLYKGALYLAFYIDFTKYVIYILNRNICSIRYSFLCCEHFLKLKADLCLNFKHNSRFIWPIRTTIKFVLRPVQEVPNNVLSKVVFAFGTDTHTHTHTEAFQYP